MREGRKKRTYHYRPTTLILSKPIVMIDSGHDVIHLTPYLQWRNNRRHHLGDLRAEGMSDYGR
jgi:hypothetical protein